jgi:hypothetical protein
MASPNKRHISAEARRLAEEILDAAAPARRLRPDVVQKLQSAITRLERHGDARAQQYARKMREQHPELRG